MQVKLEKNAVVLHAWCCQTLAIVQDVGLPLPGCANCGGTKHELHVETADITVVQMGQGAPARLVPIIDQVRLDFPEEASPHPLLDVLDHMEYPSEMLQAREPIKYRVKHFVSSKHCHSQTVNLLLASNR